MDSRQYELTYILPPSLAEDEITAMQETVQGWIAMHGGEITKVSQWGRRRLAYSLQNYKEGYYILYQFTTAPNNLKDLDRRLRLDTSVLRHLIIRLDD
jgi:small subunit ribosomal protein S6